MKILFVASEVAPFAKTGGLADVSAALPRQLNRNGHAVRLFMPLYARVYAKFHLTPVEELENIDISLGSHSYRVSVFTAPLPGSGMPVYFVHCPQLYGRPSIYTADADEHLRFLVLSRAALTACQRMRFAPDVIHCNDWQTALIPLTLRVRYSWDKEIFEKSKTVLTIHNLMYQGTFPASVLGDTGLSDAAGLFHQDQLKDGRINSLLHGILYADAVTTVSPTYSREIQSPELGAGLDGLLRARSSTVVGILNGVDYDDWNPQTDKLIPQNYSPDTLALKERNKQVLLEKSGLPYRREVPLAGVVSRLAGQKGFDLLPDALPRFLARSQMQLVALGTGEQRLEEVFRSLERTFPGRVRFHNGYSEEVAHLIEAGADFFLMPSRYEPCGLNQMYSLKYGTIPVVHETGGLADTVEHWDGNRGTGTGFVFKTADGTGLAWAVERALEAFRDPAAWKRLMQNAMAKNYSWERQARIYEELYSRL